MSIRGIRKSIAPTGLFVGSLALLLFISGCSRSPDNQQPPSFDVSPPAIRPVPLTVESIDDFLHYAAMSPVSDKERLRERIAAHAGDEEIGMAIQKQYKALLEEDFDFALLTLSVLGELRAPNSIPLFSEILETQMSDNERDLEHGLSRRDSLNMLQAKAVEGLAYLNDSQADEIVLETAASHPSRAVRSAAVQAMLYNAEDKEEAHKKLSDVLRDEDLPLLDLVRRTGAQNREEFNKKLAEFYAKHPEEVAKAPGDPTEDTDADYQEESDPGDELVTPQGGKNR